MRKLLKFVSIAAGVLIGVLVLATFALRLFYPAAKLRRIVEEQIRTRLNRETQLGDVRLDLRGIAIQHFKLSEVPSFSKGGTFLTVNSMEVRWALTPLLSKQILIRAIVLDKPQINLIRNADGKSMNISDLTASQPAEPSAKTKASARTAGAAWPWAILGIQLKNGTIHLTDRTPAALSSTLSDIDLSIRNFDATRMTGQLTMKQLQNPVYTARDFSAEWTLNDVDPTLGRLNGTLRINQGPGVAQNITRLAKASESAKVALTPLIVLQNLDQSGFVKLGLPDFSRLDIQRIDGRYTFKAGTMKIDTFEIVSTQATIGALGTVELASGKLAVDVTLHTPKPTLGGETDLKLSITGTVSNPKTNLDHLKKKAFKATVNQLLSNPEDKKKIDKALKDIFH